MPWQHHRAHPGLDTLEGTMDGAALYAPLLGPFAQRARMAARSLGGRSCVGQLRAFLYPQAGGKTRVG